MSRFTNSCKLMLVSGAWLLTSVPANAATVTLAGDNFNLSYEDTQPGLSTYGTPNYGPGSNNIFFNQIGFSASAAGIGDTDSLASTVSFTLTRNSPTFNFESLQLVEFGNYTLNGAGASVNLSGSMAVTSNAFGPSLDPAAAILAAGTLDINDNLAHNWNGGAFADLTVPGTGLFGPASWENQASITISINNILTASTTEVGSSAFIQKLQTGQAVQIGVNGSPASAVPVPGAVWLMISGLLGLFGIARRK